MISFRPMGADDYARFLDYFIPDYAADIVDNYRLDKHSALEEATQQTAASLPEGARTPGHELHCIMMETDGKSEEVGFLWYKPDPALRSAFIYDFYLHPEKRHQGVGSAALRHLESQLAAQGFIQLKLRVAAKNAHARHVYERGGFEVTGVNMNKILKG